MSRPMTAPARSRRSGPRPSWMLPPADPALFLSKTPSHHTLVSSAAAASVTQARQIDNSVNVPRVNVLFVLGGPASGKTALSAEIVATHPGAIHLEVRSLVRAAAQSGGALGERIKATFKVGKALPPTVTATVVRDAMLAASSAGPFVLSDFPRTLEHVEAFASLTEGSLPVRISALVLPSVGEEAAAARCKAVDANFLDATDMQLPEATLVKRAVAFEGLIAPVLKSLALRCSLHTLEPADSWETLSAAAKTTLATVAGFDMAPAA